MSRKPVIGIRRPGERAAIERFVSGDRTSELPSVQAPKRPDVQTAKGLVARSDGRVRRRMTVYLPPELAKRLSVYCASHGFEMSSVIAEALAVRMESKP